MDNLLEINNLLKTFDGLRAVDDFSITINQGSITGLIGPNGAGKTTLFNVITGFLDLEVGKILFKSQDISNWPPYKVAKIGISRTFQDLRLISRLSVLDNILLSCPNQVGENFLPAILQPRRVLAEEKLNKKKAKEILEFVGLTDKQNDLANNLSYGQQKLLTLACCLATDAELLLLDEPVSGIHPDMIETTIKLMKKLIQLGKTILYIEHNIEAVRQVSGHVIVMDHGQKIADGPPLEILNNQEILEAYLE